MNKHLEKLYLNENSPTFFAGVNALFKEAKKRYPAIKQKHVREFLEGVDTYTLHKTYKKYKPLKTIAAGLDVDHQIDLCDMQKIKKYNRGFGYILTCTDTLSRYSWAYPVKTKEPKEIVKAYQNIIDEERTPWRIFSDKGNEFKGSFKKLLEDLEIQQIFMQNPITKAGIVERYNRTLKGRLYRYLTENKTWHWLKILPKIVKAINYSVNRVTGMRPVDVTHSNDQKLYEKLYKNVGKQRRSSKKSKGRFRPGDLVRISTEKSRFSKGYTPNYSLELFIIAKRINRDRIIYKIKSLDNENIEGIFYENELVRVKR